MPVDNLGSTDKGTGNPAPTASSAAPSTPAPSAVASLEKIAAAPAAPSAAEGDTPSGVPPASATTPAPSSTPGEPDYWSRIPEQRRNTILENARRETEARVRQEIAQQYSWANGIKPEDAQAAFGIVQRMYANPVAFLTELQEELRQHPQYSTHFQSEAEDDTWPEPDLRSEPDPKTGEARRAWSDKSLSKILDIQERKILRQVEKQYGPLMQWAEGRDSSDRVAALKAEVADTVSTVMAEARQLPYFKEHEKEIGEALGKIPVEVRDRIGAVAALYQAYHTILQTKVFPGMSVKAEQDARDQLTRKAAAAAGSVHPNAGQPGGGESKPRNVDELARHLARLAGAAG